MSDGRGMFSGRRAEASGFDSDQPDLLITDERMEIIGKKDVSLADKDKLSSPYKIIAELKKGGADGLRALNPRPWCDLR